ncbi:hypothetical protein RSK20926_14399 [Roseobacter sp. SK209-2-6]|uniref:hypothetical protein n=1 Tax=Roseobacter sp. SK209-2-6 TaxID=388739 RepID=UPI0000F3D4F0|nr:hypothetical protein [Roseobacter sp. SK209-2-6]EBA15829.1 hypothetical protein RSK20926_14399 [Roseobacter sp. SK209-2-6]
MKFLLGWAASFSIALTAQQAVAAEPQQKEYVTCVQNQLRSLGQANVSVTGRLDSATKTATNAVLEQGSETKGLTLLPRITNKTAVSWCRELAALRPALKRYMPSAKPPIVVAEGGTGSLQTKLVSTAFKNVESFFRAHYGIHLASRVDVAGAASGEELAKLAVGLQRQRGQSYGGMSSSISRICRTPSLGYGGQAYRDQLLICWKHRSRYDQAWYKKVSRMVSSIMAHEYMHHLQRELTNDKIWKANYRSQAKMGPLWMVEGGAELAEYNWRIKRGGGKVLPFNTLMKPAAKSAKNLRAMQRWQSIRGREEYATSRFAVYLLARRFGEEAIIDYWRYLGQGNSWEAAFKAAFGMSMGEYYQKFETVRRNSKLAAAFAAGH